MVACGQSGIQNLQPATRLRCHLSLTDLFEAASSILSLPESSSFQSFIFLPFTSTLTLNTLPPSSADRGNSGDSGYGFAALVVNRSSPPKAVQVTLRVGSLTTPTTSPFGENRKTFPPPYIMLRTWSLTSTARPSSVVPPSELK